jgi:excisionase family DNA binding protein
LRQADQTSLYLTPLEVSQVLRVSVLTVYQWLKTGKIQAVRFGNSWRIPRENVMPGEAAEHASSGDVLRRRIYEEIVRERLAQDLEWGGTKHDDQHTQQDWLGFILKQIARAGESVFSIESKPYRKHLIKVAALAVAALESYDRQVEGFVADWRCSNDGPRT